MLICILFSIGVDVADDRVAAVPGVASANAVDVVMPMLVLVMLMGRRLDLYTGVDWC